MKNVVFTWHRWISLVAILLMGTGVFAQPRFGFRNDSTRYAMRDSSRRFGLSLTAEQQEQIAALREANQQEMTDIRNDLAIKRAELQKLQSAENVNRNEVNQKLDEIGQLNTELSKKSFALEQDIYDLLTEEQRSAYRYRPGRMYYGFPDISFNLDPGWRGMQGRIYASPRMGMNRGRR